LICIASAYQGGYRDVDHIRSCAACIASACQSGMGNVNHIGSHVEQKVSCIATYFTCSTRDNNTNKGQTLEEVKAGGHARVQFLSKCYGRSGRS